MRDLQRVVSVLNLLTGGLVALSLIAAVGVVLLGNPGAGVAVLLGGVVAVFLLFVLSSVCAALATLTENSERSADALEALLHNRRNPPRT